MAGIGIGLDFRDTFELSLESDLSESVVIENELEDLSEKELF
jgi:hypothetical protein